MGVGCTEDVVGGDFNLEEYLSVYVRIGILKIILCFERNTNHVCTVYISMLG